MTTAWMDDARCADIPYFTDLDVREQRPVCFSCPVRSTCLEHGLDWMRTGGQAVPAGTVGYAGWSPNAMSDLLRVEQGKRPSAPIVTPSPAPNRRRKLSPRVDAAEIAARIEASGLTLAQAADRCGVPHETLRRIVRGHVGQVMRHTSDRIMRGLGGAA